jgi:hypothetical protein
MDKHGHPRSPLKAFENSGNQKFRIAIKGPNETRDAARAQPLALIGPLHRDKRV